MIILILPSTDGFYKNKYNDQDKADNDCSIDASNGGG